MTAAEIAKALGKHRRVGREWECLCPAHNDHKPSLSIGEEDGKILVHCFAGCDQTAVIDVLKQRALWPQTESRQNGCDRTQEQKRSAEIIYPYVDESGELLFEVVRKGHGPEKTFFQRAPDGKGGWKCDKKGKLTIEGVRRVPYRLPQLIEAAAKRKGAPWRVFFTEGEKDADRLAEWGLTTTTCPQSHWRKEYAGFFSGADVVITADNDAKGRKQASIVASGLAPVADTVRIVEFPSLPEGGDVSDWIDANSDGKPSDLDALIEDIKPFRPTPVTETGGIILKCGADFTPRKVDWLWPGWLPRGKLTVLAGMKTAGKSTLCFTFLATITIGGLWPDGTSAEPGDVLVWSGEDDFEDTILPRFLMAGGDPLRIFPVHHVLNTNGDKRAFDPAEDLPALQEVAKRLPNPRALMIDPIVMAVPAGNDSHKNTETRRGLQPLVDFTVDLNIATIGVTHFTKGTADQNPIDRVTGSLAFGAIPRVVLAAAADAEDKQRRLVRIASNIGPSGGGFEFLLTQEPLDGFDFSAQRVRWGGHLQGPAKDLLEMKGQTEKMRAAQFLLDQLDATPLSVKELADAARAHGIAWRTVERAKENLSITAKKSGKTWCWELSKPNQWTSP